MQKTFLFLARNPSGYTAVYQETPAREDNFRYALNEWVNEHTELQEGWVVYVIPLDSDDVLKFTVEREPPKLRIA